MSENGEYVEKGKASSDFTIRQLPKIFLDPCIKMDDAHSRKEPEEWLPYCAPLQNLHLLQDASRAVLDAIAPAIPHIEVIKLYFYWNVNHGGKQRICCDITIVDAGTGRKRMAEVHMGIYLDPKRKPSVDLLKFAQTAKRVLRQQVLFFGAARAKCAASSEKFDSLFSEINPVELQPKSYCGVND